MLHIRFADNHTSGSPQTHMYFRLSLLSTPKVMSAATQATKWFLWQTKHSRCKSIPVSTVLRQSVKFFIINVFLFKNLKLSKLKSGKWFGQSVKNTVWMSQKPRKGEFGGLKCKKCPGGACSLSVFILDLRLHCTSQKSFGGPGSQTLLFRWREAMTGNKSLFLRHM